MAISKPTSVLSFVLVAILGSAGVFGDKLQGHLRKGLKYIATVDTKTIIHPNTNNLRVPTKQEQHQGMTAERAKEIHDQVYGHYHQILNQRFHDFNPQNHYDETTVRGRLYRNFDQVLSQEHDFPDMTPEQIAWVRGQVAYGRNDLATKLQQPISVYDSYKNADPMMDLEAARSKFFSVSKDAKEVIAAMQGDTRTKEKKEAVTFESVFLYEDDIEDNDTDRVVDTTKPRCGLKFQTENTLAPNLKTRPNTYDEFGRNARSCQHVSTIVTEKDVDPRSMHGNGECNFDVNYGYWYKAHCEVREEDGLPEFVLTKAFCAAGCQFCMDPKTLPNLLGTDFSPVWRASMASAKGVCELSVVQPNTLFGFGHNEAMPVATPTDSLWIHHEGNCLQETCDYFV